MLRYRVVGSACVSALTVTYLAIVGNPASSAVELPDNVLPSPISEPGGKVRSISQSLGTGVGLVRADEGVGGPYQSVLSIEIAGLPEIRYPGYPLDVRPH